MTNATLQKTKSGTGQIQAPPIRYCLYARKSTESDEKQALSIESQIKEMLKIAEEKDLNVVEIKKESHSAKDSGKRPIFNQMIKEIKQGKFDGILSWHPDRLSRNAGDLVKIVDLMDSAALREIRTYRQQFTDSPSQKFLLMILGSQAKLENDNKSVNVKRGLRVKVEKGLWVGVPPTGYLKDKRRDRKGHLLVDPKRAPVIRKMFKKVGNEHWTGRDVYDWLKKIDFRTKNNKHLSLSNIYLILKRSFYTGTFEYPRGSGNWYKGQHKPIISEELFNRVQERIHRDNIERSRTKEFAFTKLIKCGLCGSGITADEKFKTLKDGTKRRYVYYGCTKSKDIHCKCGYIREKDLIKQLLKIIDKVDLDELGMKEKIKKEVERYKKFRHGVLGIEDKENPQNKIRPKDYAKYLLKEGSIIEKRELLSNLKSKLIFKDKKIYLKK